MIWIVLEVVAALVVVLSLVVVSTVLLPTRRASHSRLAHLAARAATQQDRRVTG
jgi:type II secretory pathway pseudopilin PulG